MPIMIMVFRDMGTVFLRPCLYWEYLAFCTKAII
jgi:hypothetical protein